MNNNRILLLCGEGGRGEEHMKKLITFLGSSELTTVAINNVVKKHLRF